MSARAIAHFAFGFAIVQTVMVVVWVALGDPLRAFVAVAALGLALFAIGLTDEGTSLSLFRRRHVHDESGCGEFV